MNDLISRQMVIDKINERQRKLIYCFGFENDMVKIMDIAKNIVIAIPSAQPEIVKCKDCKYNVSSHKCLHPESFFLVSDDNFYCGLAERRTDE